MACQGDQVPRLSVVPKTQVHRQPCRWRTLTHQYGDGMTTTFTGEVRIPGAIENGLPSTITLDAQTLILTAGGTELGRWNRADLALSRDPDGTFRLTLGSEIVLFNPDSPLEFAILSGMPATASPPVGTPSGPAIPVQTPAAAPPAAATGAAPPVAPGPSPAEPPPVPAPAVSPAVAPPAVASPPAVSPADAVPPTVAPPPPAFALPTGAAPATPVPPVAATPPTTAPTPAAAPPVAPPTAQPPVDVVAAGAAAAAAARATVPGQPAAPAGPLISASRLTPVRKRRAPLLHFRPSSGTASTQKRRKQREVRNRTRWRCKARLSIVANPNSNSSRLRRRAPKKRPTLRRSRRTDLACSPKMMRHLLRIPLRLSGQATKAARSGPGPTTTLPLTTSTPLTPRPHSPRRRRIGRTWCRAAESRGSRRCSHGGRACRAHRASRLVPPGSGCGLAMPFRSWTRSSRRTAPRTSQGD